MCVFRVKSSAALHRAFNVDPLYLQHENAGVAVDYMVGETRNETEGDGKGFSSIGKSR